MYSYYTFILEKLHRATHVFTVYTDSEVLCMIHLNINVADAKQSIAERDKLMILTRTDSKRQQWKTLNKTKIFTIARGAMGKADLTPLDINSLRQNIWTLFLFRAPFPKSGIISSGLIYSQNDIYTHTHITHSLIFDTKKKRKPMGLKDFWKSSFSFQQCNNNHNFNKKIVIWWG